MSSQAEKSKKKQLLSIAGFVVLGAIFVALMVNYVYKRAENSINLIGMACNADDECGTNAACCPQGVSGLVGICMECCSNSDCAARFDPTADFPPPGEFHTPFCIDNTCQAYQNKEFSQIPQDGYPVYVPSETLDNAKSFHKLMVPRHVREEGPVMTQVTYIDFDDQDETLFNKEEVIYNGTHITIPSYKAIHAGYSKSYHQFDEHETGIVTLAMGENIYSTVTDYPLAGSSEKYHTLTYDGIQDTSRGDYIAQRSAQQLAYLNSVGAGFDKTAYFARVIGTVLAQKEAKTPGQLVEASFDRAHSWQVRRFVNSYPDVWVETPSWPNWANHTSKAKQAIEYARDPTFQRDIEMGTLECKHYEPVGGLSYTENSVTFPLDRPITSWTGVIKLSPTYYMDIGIGVMIVHYDESENVLQIYKQDYQYSRQNADIQFPGPYPSGLWVSPVSSGPEYYVDPDVDGRGDFFFSMEQPEDDKISFLSPEADFTLWARERSEICAPEVEEASFWEDIDITKAPKGSNSIYDYVSQTANILDGITRGMPCGDIWMRTDYGRDTHGAGPLETTMVWTHTLGEIRNDKTKELATAEYWDGWECFYQAALCSEDL